MLKKIIRDCANNGGKVVFLDGRTDKRVLRFIEDLDLSCKFIFNDYKLNLGNAMEYRGYYGLVSNIIKKIKKGLKIVFTSSIASKCHELYETILDQVRGYITKDEILIITDQSCKESKNSKLLKTFVKDPDKYLKDNGIRVLIFSNKLGPGVNISGGNTKAYFDEQFIYFSSKGSLPDDTLNCARRVRNFKKKNFLSFFIDTTKANWIPRIYSRKYFDNKDEELRKFFESYSGLDINLTKLDDVLTNQIYLNMVHQDICNRYIEDSTYFYLEKCGFNVKERLKVSLLKNLTFKSGSKIKEPEYYDVKVLNKLEYNELVAKGNYSIEEEFQIKRYLLDSCVKDQSNDIEMLWKYYLKRSDRVFNTYNIWRVMKKNKKNIDKIERFTERINQDSDNVNFRVESNGNQNMLFVDGGDNRVGIGTSSPEDLLHIHSTGDTNLRIKSTANKSQIRFQNDTQSWFTGITSDESYFWYGTEIAGTVGFIQSSGGNLYWNYHFLNNNNGYGLVGRATDGNTRNTIKIDSSNNVLVGDSNLAGNTYTYSASRMYINTDAGQCQIGPQNTSWNHIYTDRQGHLFDSNLTALDGKFQSYSGVDVNLRRSQGDTDRLLIQSGISTFSTGLHVEK